jgi:hypothetical protein
MKRENKQLFNALTIGSTQTSAIMSIQDIYCLSLVTTVAGASISGTVKLQVSNDKGSDDVGTGVSNWADYGTARTLSAAGSFADNFDGIGFKWARVVYTTAGGTGTITAWINGKGA